MQTWVTLAAKHATLATGIGLGTIPSMGWESLDGMAVGVLLAGAGFAAVNSSRQLRSFPLLPPDRAGTGRTEPNRQQTGAFSRIRRRVDGALTSMLSDDSEHPVAQLPALAAVPSVAELPASRPGTARSPWELADYADTVVARPARQERVGDWPYLTVVREPGLVQDAASRWSAGPAGTAKSDLAFWGPKSSPVAGSRASRDTGKVAGQFIGEAETGRAVGGRSGEGRPADSRRPAPRHAAPPARLGVTLGRRLASPRFTSRSAAHAG